MKSKIILTLMSIILFNSNYLFAVDYDKLTTLQIEFPDPTKDTLVVGGGFDYPSQNAKDSQCVTGVEVLTGKPTGTIQFLQTIDESALKSNLGLAASGKSRFGATEVSAAADFYKNSKENEYSISLNYYSEYNFGNKVLSNVELSKLGLDYVGVPDLFYKKCGQGYVRSVTKAAKFFLNIKIDFSSQESKDAFSANFKYSNPVTSLAGSIENGSEKMDKKARVTVSVFQLGGDVDKLTGIFGINKTNTPKDSANSPEINTDKKEPETVESNQSYNFVQCSSGNIKLCTGVLANAISYATDINNVNSFPSQIKDGKKAVNLLYEIYPYYFKELVQYPGLSQMVEQAKSELMILLDENINQVSRVNNILHGVVSLTKKQDDLLKSVYSTLKKQQEKIKQAKELCYLESESKCPLAVSTLTQDIFNDGDLKSKSILEPEMYAQFCSSALSPFSKLDKKTKESTLAIQEILERQMPFSLGEKNYLISSNYYDSKKTDDEKCEILGQYLEGQPELDFSKSGSNKYTIWNLKPIQNLKNTKSLSIVGQSLNNLNEIEEWESLEYLNAQNNLIKDVSKLFKNIALRDLRLSFNLIRELPDLSNLANLKHLEIRGLPTELNCPEISNLDCRKAVPTWTAQFTTESYSGVPHYFPEKSEIQNVGMLVTGGYNYPFFNVISLFGIYDPVQIAYKNFNLTPQTIFGKNLTSDKYFFQSGGFYESSDKLIKKSIDSLKFNSADTFQLENAIMGHSMILLNDGSILIAGGSKDSFEDFGKTSTSRAFLVDSLSLKPKSRMIMPSKFAWHKDFTLKNGNILFIGGLDNNKGLSQIVEFNVLSKTFQVWSNGLKIGRGAFAISELPNDRLLISGGIISNQQITDTSEILDLNSKKSKLLTSTMYAPRAFHQTISLPNGDVLLIGGAIKADFLKYLKTNPTRSDSPIVNEYCDKFGSNCYTSSVDFYLNTASEFAPSLNGLSFARSNFVTFPLSKSEENKTHFIVGGPEKNSASNEEMVLFQSIDL